MGQKGHPSCGPEQQGHEMGELIAQAQDQCSPPLGWEAIGANPLQALQGLLAAETLQAALQCGQGLLAAEAADRSGGAELHAGSTSRWMALSLAPHTLFGCLRTLGVGWVWLAFGSVDGKAQHLWRRWR